MNGSNMDGTDAPKKPDDNRKPLRRRPTRRCIYIIVAVLILCIVISIVLAVQLRPKSKDDCPKGVHCDWRSMPHTEFLKDERCDSLCNTRPCIRSAQYVLSRIDSSADPCEDFYEFACGTYEQEAFISPEQNEGVSTSQEMENEVLLNLKEIIDSIDENSDKTSFALRIAKMIYNDCMETDHNPEVLTKQIWKKLFAENGKISWPLINANARNDQKHVAKLMVSTLLYGTNPFFKIIDIGAETMNKKNFLLFRFEKSNINLLKSIYKDQNPDDEESALSRYIFAVGRILTEVGVDSNELKVLVTKFQDVEKHFLNLTTKAIEENENVYEKNEHLRYESRNHSCQDLDHHMRNIEWCELVKQLRKEYGFLPEMPIRIDLPSLGNYFAAIDTLLGHHLDRDIINYLGVKFIFEFMEYMPSPLRDIYHREKDLFTDRRISLPLTARWQQCIDVVTDFVSLPLEREYLKEKLDEKARDQVRNMVNKIKESYLSRLDKMSWVKAALKGTDPKKVVRDGKLKIGRADFLLNADEEAVDKLYSLGFTSDEVKMLKKPLLLDVLQMIEFENKARMIADIDDNIFGASRFFGLYHRFDLESIDLPYKLLAFPIFLPGRPMYVEYATLGMFISNYITSILLLKMKPGNLTMQEFLSVANCLSEQSHLYRTGEILYEEDMFADIGKLSILVLQTLGTHVSFQAYADYLRQNGNEKGLPGLPFTNEQLYFISAAQAQCEKFSENGDPNQHRNFPAKLRVNIPFAHSKEFSQAFRCPADSSMNLKRRCCFLGDGKLSHDCK